MFFLQYSEGVVRSFLVYLFTFVTLMGVYSKPAVLDLSDWDSSPMKITSEWDFFWMEWLHPHQSPDSQPYKVIAHWNSIQDLPPYGYGTYRLLLDWGPHPVPESIAIRLDSVGTAYRIYGDGRELGHVGIPSRSQAESQPAVNTQTFYFSPSSPQVELLIQVSNYEDVAGGFWDSVYIGEPSLLHTRTTHEVLADVFLAGALLVIGLVFLVLYFQLRGAPRTEYGLFGFFAMIMALRISLVNQRVLVQLFSPLGNHWEFWGAMEYWTIYGAIPAFTGFILALFPELSKKWYPKVLWGLFLGGTLFILLTPSRLFTGMMTAMQLYLLVMMVFSLVQIIRGVVRGLFGSPMVLLGASILVVTAVNDIVVSRTSVYGTHLTPLGTFLFFITLAYILAVRFFRTYQESEGLSRDLKLVNLNLQRFVPSEILTFLQKKELSQIQLGDHTSREMTVLFADIQSFNKLTREMNSEDCFAFLNSYYRMMGPIIRSHGGFVDKYIGDSIMALFPGRPQDALDAAVAMQSQVVGYNSGRNRAGYRAITLGIGIHSGKVTMGTIGEPERMEGTVISDVVNLARRIESLSRLFDSQILMSDQVFRQLDNANDFTYMFLGKIRVKGKSDSIGVYEVLDGCEPHIFENKKRIAPLFERGLLYYHLGEQEEAHRIFRQVLKEDPTHRATKFYLNTSPKSRQDWNTSLTMEIK